MMAVAFGALLTLTAGPADAHPLGNFTVNRYARVEVSGGRLRVYYVLDEAEIPAFEDRAAVARSAETFVSGRAATIVAGLSLTVDGSAVPLRLVASTLSQPQGQAGLHTLRLALRLEASGPQDGLPHVGAFSDTNEPDRIGWREIVVSARGGATLQSSTVPSTDLSDELRHYPANLVQSPLNLRSARFRFIPGETSAPALPLIAPAAAPPRAGGSFARLITRQHVSLWGLAGMLLIAAGFGGAHALAPGHGKTIMAAYVAGGQGRVSDAALIGVVVAVMHTGSVLGLGAVLFQVSRSMPLDRVYPWLTLVAGVVIAAYGARLVRRRWMLGRPLVSAGASPEHHRADGGHSHLHDHHHEGHGHPHSHGHELPATVRPLSRQGLVMLATAGGLFPSPTALLVLVAAFTLGRVGLGLALVAAFSVGLALTLSGVAIALVYGGQVARRHMSLSVVAWLPLASAVVVALLGLTFVVKGIQGLA